MRKSFVAIFCLALIAVCFFVRRSPTTNATPAQSAHGEPTSIVAASETQPAATRPRFTKPSRSEVPPSDVPAVSNAIVYGPADFANGELQNIVVDESGIRLGADTAFVPRFNPKFRLFGNFISPEIASREPFDSLNLNMEASGLEQNEVNFEVRTRARDGSWSEWREIRAQAMKEPFSIESPRSIGWQYRVVLFANDAPSSPRIESISIEPLSGQTQKLSANNNTK